MTYPPQQGGGYGPPQGGGHPQQGGHQQGGHQQGYPAGGGYGPPPGGPPPGYGPPRRSKTPLIVGIVVAVLVIGLAVLLLFLFTGDDEPTPRGTGNGGSGQSAAPPGAPASGGQTPGPASPGPGSGDGTGSPDEIANKIVDTINNQDFDAIDTLSCDAQSAAGMKREMGKLQGLDITAALDEVEQNGTTGSVNLTLTGEGVRQSVSVELAQNDGKWCAAGV